MKGDGNYITITVIFTAADFARTRLCLSTTRTDACFYGGAYYFSQKTPLTSGLALYRFFILPNHRYASHCNRYVQSMH